MAVLIGELFEQLQEASNLTEYDNVKDFIKWLS